MFDDARHEVCDAARKMWQAGLVAGSSGNVSRRISDGHIAITPTSIPYDALTADDIVIIELANGSVAGNGEPSYELPMHLAVYRSRPDAGALVHTHSPCVTALSVLRRPLPPVLDEMVVHFGGTIELADYAFTGTDAVGTNVVRTLGDRNAVLLANHGNLCVARTLNAALQLAIAMEAGARIYLEALLLGTPVPLPDDSLVAGRRLHEQRR
jgi:L-fuculose-phosphate aldolase